MLAKKSLADIVEIRLNRYSKRAGIILAITVALLASAIFLSQQIKNQRALLVTIQSNVTLLAQNSDNREIERVLNSFLDAIPGASVFVVRNTVTQVSLPDMSRTLKTFVPAQLIKFFGAHFTYDGYLETSIPLNDSLSHSSFGLLILRTPLTPIAIYSGLVALITAFMTLWFFGLWRRLVRKSLAKAIQPIGHIHEDIQRVGSGQQPLRSSSDFEIAELATISDLIGKQHESVRALTEVTSRAEGERRAKEGVRSLMHDLLNPYSAISNLIQASLLYPNDPDVKHELSTQWPVLNSQIKSLLKAARHIEVEETKPINADLLKTVQEGASSGAVKNAKALEVSLYSTPIIVKHDPILLSRAIANLVRNSIEEGASRVNVWCEQSPLSVHIQDDGPGIPVENIPQLFEGRLKSGKPDGSGIGFPTALRLVKAHRGKITLEQNVGQTPVGAHFKIDLSELEFIP